MRIKKVVFIIFSVLSIILIGSYYRTKIVEHPFNYKNNSFNVVVDKGENLNSIINNLKEKKIINNSFLVKFYIKFNKVDTNIKPGSYNFSKDISLKNFIKNLNQGIYDKNIVKVTIPEGYDVEKISYELEKNGVINKEDFLKSCKNYKIPYYNNKEKRKYSVEGYLYPDTYFLLKDMQGKDVIDIMLKRFDFIINDIVKNNVKNSKKTSINDYDIDKLIIMASIVEKEVEQDNERGKVASVFYNRINKNMKLESCATVLYALGKHKDKLYYKDLKVKSPYNTYIVKSLPVGPICCPGRNSIEASMYPAKTNYLYFVSNNNGTHFFTDNYDEFLEIKEKTQGN